MLQGINDTLVDRLADNVGRSISRAMNPVAESMDRFIVGATRNQIEGVNHIVSRFLSEMDRSMGNQFTSLAQTMSALEQEQIRAARATSENLASAEGIIRNAQTLQEITSRALDKFDSYMSQLNTVRERDENFDIRAAELLNDMRQESRDMAALIASLGEKVQNIPDPSDSADYNNELREIRDLMARLNDQVKNVSDTLTSLSEED
jgi:chromosome segregation ATPase